MLDVLSMLGGARSRLLSTMLRGRHGPPCCVTSEENRFGELEDLLMATQNVDWLPRVVAPGLCFLSWGSAFSTRREECEEVSHSTWDLFILLWNSCNIPLSAWSGREKRHTQVSPRPRHHACLHPSQLLLPPGSGLTQPL